MSLPNPINVTYVSPQSGDTFPFIYIVKDTDNIINIDTTHGAVHVILRNIRNSGMLQYQPLLSINDGGNNAFFNNITIYPSEGDTINDSTSYVLNTNGSNSILQISNIDQWVVASTQNPIPFEGSNYVYVYGNGTPLENGQELLNAYARAKEMVGYNKIEPQLIDVGTIDVIYDDLGDSYWETSYMPMFEILDNYLNYVGDYFTSLIMNPPLIENDGYPSINTNSEDNTYSIRYNYNLEGDSRFGLYDEVQLVPIYFYNLINFEQFEIVVSIPEEGYFESAIYNKSVLSPYLTDNWYNMSLNIGGIYYTGVQFNQVDTDAFYFSYSTNQAIPEVGIYNDVKCSISEAYPTSFEVNEISLIIGAGEYELTESWVVDTPMNIVSLTGNADVNLYISELAETPCLIFEYDDVGFYLYNSGRESYRWRIKGIKQGENGDLLQPIKINANNNFIIENCVSLSPYGFSADDGFSLNVDFINCRGNQYSFNAQYCYGTYTNCSSGWNSFGFLALEIDAIYDNCVGRVDSEGTGSNCFGSSATNCFGVYKNCVAQRRSFGYNCTILSATFENCSGMSRDCFGYDVQDSVTSLFINCRSYDRRSFCYNASQGSVQIGSTFINCRSSNTSFCYDNDGDSMTVQNCIFLNCSSEWRCFGYDLNSNSSNNLLINCVADFNSFGIKGNYFNCYSKGGGSFQGLTESLLTDCFAQGGSFYGANCIYNNCISGGEGSFWNYIDASNEYNNCKAGLNSFIEFDNNEGSTENKLYFCRLTDGTFPNSTGAGLIRQSIDGSNVLINQG